MKSPATPRTRTRDRTRPAIAAVALYAVIGVAFAHVAVAADEQPLERLASCQDSWLDWKDNAPRISAYRQYIEMRLKRDDDGPAFAPKTPAGVFGLAVTQVYPQSIGMGVGFSVLVDADLPTARRLYEKQLGRPMTCHTSDGMTSCELVLGDRKTALVMAEAGAGRPTLAGCYYFYAQ